MFGNEVLDNIKSRLHQRNPISEKSDFTKIKNVLFTRYLCIKGKNPKTKSKILITQYAIKNLYPEYIKNSLKTQNNHQMGKRSEQITH